jgi:hypothetical protein
VGKTSFYYQCNLIRFYTTVDASLQDQRNAVDQWHLQQRLKEEGDQLVSEMQCFLDTLKQEEESLVTRTEELI